MCSILLPRFVNFNLQLGCQRSVFVREVCCLHICCPWHHRSCCFYAPARSLPMGGSVSSALVFPILSLVEHHVCTPRKGRTQNRKQNEKQFSKRLPKIILGTVGLQSAALIFISPSLDSLHISLLFKLLIRQFIWELFEGMPLSFGNNNDQQIRANPQS